MIAVILSMVLVAIAALHLAWAIGWWVPIADETALARAVVGARGVRRMPGAVPCATVAMACLFLAILPHRPALPQHDWLMRGAAALFLLRGLAAYMPPWRRRFCEEPFASLDKRCYGPLCLLLGGGYLALILGGS